MTMQKYRLLILLLIDVLLLTGCNFKSTQQENTMKYDESEDIQWLKGKTLNLTTIIDDTTSYYRVIYLFNYYDCETCIHKGFSIVNRIDDRMGTGYVKVVESRCPEVNSLQKRVQYHGYIYSDKEDCIRRMLKYTPTPILFLLNDSMKIVDAFIANSRQQDNNEMEQFIRKCCNLSFKNR